MMFGRKKDGPKEERPADPRTRITLYAMGGLYLGYLFYQMIDPYFSGIGAKPSLPILLLGTVILGGGAAALLLLAWKLYRTPGPVEEDEKEPRLEEALPEEAEEEASGEDEEI